MNISPLSSNIINLLSEEPVTSRSAALQSPSGNFTDIFTEAMNNVKDTDTADKASAVELLTGQTDDMSGLMLDMQKAEISLNLALQMRSKVLEAYNEIMRMQV